MEIHTMPDTVCLYPLEFFKHCFSKIQPFLFVWTASLLLITSQFRQCQGTWWGPCGNHERFQPKGTTWCSRSPLCSQLRAQRPGLSHCQLWALVTMATGGCWVLQGVLCMLGNSVGGILRSCLHVGLSFTWNAKIRSCCPCVSVLVEVSYFSKQQKNKLWCPCSHWRLTWECMEHSRNQGLD